jgi:OHCU decarboxylase
MSEDDFVATFGRLFQGPDWAVRHAYAQRPFSDTQDLRVAFQEAIFGATGDEKQLLMDSYPELAKVVGEDDVSDAASTQDSLADQSAAGLNHLGEEDQTAFGVLTAAYQDRFAFPLIVCVRDNPDRQHILDSGWARMHNSPTQERATALIEIANIANHRFDDFVADANPIHSARLQSFEVS